METTQLSQWQDKGTRFQFEQHNVFYRDAGDKQPVLLCLHGFPTASWDWHKIWPQLIKQFRVVAPDMLGFGFSDKPKSYPYSIFNQASLVERLLASLNISSIHILAHNYGDTVCQELLARYEQRKKTKQAGLIINKVCFLNGGLFPEAQKPLLLQKLLKSPLGALINKLTTEKLVRNRFSSIFGQNTQPSEQEWQGFWALMNFNQGRHIFHKIIQYMSERVQHRTRWVGTMQQTNIPMRFIVGSVDPISGSNMADRYMEVIPNPDIVLLESIGHYPQVEDPQGVLKALSNFLAR